MHIWIPCGSEEMAGIVVGALLCRLNAIAIDGNSSQLVNMDSFVTDMCLPWMLYLSKKSSTGAVAARSKLDAAFRLLFKAALHLNENNDAQKSLNLRCIALQCLAHSGASLEKMSEYLKKTVSTFLRTYIDIIHASSLLILFYKQIFPVLMLNRNCECGTSDWISIMVLCEENAVLCAQFGEFDVAIYLLKKYKSLSWIQGTNESGEALRPPDNICACNYATSLLLTAAVLLRKECCDSRNESEGACVDVTKYLSAASAILRPLLDEAQAADVYWFIHVASAYEMVKKAASGFMVAIRAGKKSSWSLSLMRCIERAMLMYTDIIDTIATLPSLTSGARDVKSFNADQADALNVAAEMHYDIAVFTTDGNDDDTIQLACMEALKFLERGVNLLKVNNLFDDECRWVGRCAYSIGTAEYQRGCRHGAATLAALQLGCSVYEQYCADSDDRRAAVGLAKRLCLLITCDKSPTGSTLQRALRSLQRADIFLHDSETTAALSMVVERIVTVKMHCYVCSCAHKTATNGDHCQEQSNLSLVSLLQETWPGIDTLSLGRILEEELRLIRLISKSELSCSSCVFYHDEVALLGLLDVYSAEKHPRCRARVLLQLANLRICRKALYAMSSANPRHTAEASLLPRNTASLHSDDPEHDNEIVSDLSNLRISPIGTTATKTSSDNTLLSGSSVALCIESVTLLKESGNSEEGISDSMHLDDLAMAYISLGIAQLDAHDVNALRSLHMSLYTWEIMSRKYVGADTSYTIELRSLIKSLAKLNSLGEMFSLLGRPGGQIQALSIAISIQRVVNTEVCWSEGILNARLAIEFQVSGHDDKAKETFKNAEQLMDPLLDISLSKQREYDNEWMAMREYRLILGKYAILRNYVTKALDILDLLLDEVVEVYNIVSGKLVDNHLSAGQINGNRRIRRLRILLLVGEARMALSTCHEHSGQPEKALLLAKDALADFHRAIQRKPTVIQCDADDLDGASGLCGSPWNIARLGALATVRTANLYWRLGLVREAHFYASCGASQTKVEGLFGASIRFLLILAGIECIKGNLDEGRSYIAEVGRMHDLTWTYDREDTCDQYSLWECGLTSVLSADLAVLGHTNEKLETTGECGVVAVYTKLQNELYLLDEMTCSSTTTLSARKPRQSNNSSTISSPMLLQSQHLNMTGSLIPMSQSYSTALRRHTNLSLPLCSGSSSRTSDSRRNRQETSPCSRPPLHMASLSSMALCRQGRAMLDNGEINSAEKTIHQAVGLFNCDSEFSELMCFVNRSPMIAELYYLLGFINMIHISNSFIKKERILNLDSIWRRVLPNTAGSTTLKPLTTRCTRSSKRAAAIRKRETEEIGTDISSSSAAAAAAAAHHLCALAECVRVGRPGSIPGACTAMFDLAGPSHAAAAAFFLDMSFAASVHHRYRLNVLNHDDCNDYITLRFKNIKDSLKTASIAAAAAVTQGQEFDTAALNLALQDIGSTFQKQYVDELPSTWTVCSLTMDTDGRHLLLSRLRSGETPVVHRLTLKNADTLPSRYVAELRDILEDSGRTLRATVNSDIAKADWWAQRQSLDTKMALLTDSIQNKLLGVHASLLLGSLENKETRSTLHSIAFDFAENVSKLVGSCSNTALLEACIDAAELLNDTDLEIFANTAICDVLLDDRESFNDVVVTNIVSLFIEAVNELRQCCNNMLQRARGNRAASKKKEDRSCQRKRGPTILILGDTLRELPWESMPLLRPHAISRMPSFSFILSRCGKNSYEGVSSAYYVVDPAGDLPDTRRDVGGSLKKRGSSWDGVCGHMPLSSDVEHALEERSLFVYCGHGAGETILSGDRVQKLKCRAVALLMGCSSGALRASGKLEPTGMPLYYLAAGAPAVVGNLWDVTDKDIDRFSRKLIDSWLDNDDISLLDAVRDARGVCKLSHLIGAAPVVYGVPILSGTNEKKTKLTTRGRK